MSATKMLRLKAKEEENTFILTAFQYFYPYHQHHQTAFYRVIEKVANVTQI